MNQMAVAGSAMELLGEITKRLERAELALNRHGFRDEGDAGWAAPIKATWSGGLELQYYLMVYFPEIKQQKGGLHEWALKALEICAQRQNDAASRWIRDALPSIKLTNLRIADHCETAALRSALENAQVLVNQYVMERDNAIAERDCARSDLSLFVETMQNNEDDAALPPDAPRAPVIRLKTIWPDPKTMNFNLADRRDPMNMGVRHESLQRRSTDHDDTD